MTFCGMDLQDLARRCGNCGSASRHVHSPPRRASLSRPPQRRTRQPCPWSAIECTRGAPSWLANAADCGLSRAAPPWIHVGRLARQSVHFCWWARVCVCVCVGGGWADHISVCACTLDVVSWPRYSTFHLCANCADYGERELSVCAWI